MARMKASNYVENCPISDKAYFTFVKRIMSVVFGPDCELMLQTLNRYLEGDRLTYAELLDGHLRITFELLRFEIDKAIERSARARARTRRPRRSEECPAHRQESDEKVPAKDTGRRQPNMTDRSFDISPNSQIYDESVDTTTVSSRRKRRAKTKRIRYKWRKIG